MSDPERLDGLYVGLLDESELWLFEAMIRDGLAYRSYEGAGGFMDLAKVRFRREISYGKATP